MYPTYIFKRNRWNLEQLFKYPLSYLNVLCSACPFEILNDVKKEPESVTEDVTSAKEGNPETIQAELREMPLRPRRQAARAGEERRRLLTNAWSRWLSWLDLKAKLRRNHLVTQL